MGDARILLCVADVRVAVVWCLQLCNVLPSSDVPVCCALCLNAGLTVYRYVDARMITNNYSIILTMKQYRFGPRLRYGAHFLGSIFGVQPLGDTRPSELLPICLQSDVFSSFFSFSDITPTGLVVALWQQNTLEFNFYRGARVA